MIKVMIRGYSLTVIVFPIRMLHENKDNMLEVKSSTSCAEHSQTHLHLSWFSNLLNRECNICTGSEEVEKSVQSCGSQRQSKRILHRLYLIINPRHCSKHCDHVVNRNKQCDRYT